MMYDPSEEGFEGPEKTLHVTFEAESLEACCAAGGLRSVGRERWSQTLELARCQILSVMSNEHCDSYVLSESSLFVYERRVILKTCGTTRLLLALDDIVALAASRGLRARSVVYTRKNFTFPARQLYPHTSFADERAFLDERFGGRSIVAGPLTDDHWYFYVADLARPGDADLAARGDHVFEVRMHELHESAAAMFFQNSLREGVTGAEVTAATGIGGLVPGMSIDEHLFEPCGYSMNGLLGPWYATIHVTPESHCSYASFETNLPLASYDALLAAVLAVFRPSTFTAHLVSPVASEHVLAASGASLNGESVLSQLAGGLDVRTWNFIATSDDRRVRRLVRGMQYCAGASVSVTPVPEMGGLCAQDRCFAACGGVTPSMSPAPCASPAIAFEERSDMIMDWVI